MKELKRGDTLQVTIEAATVGGTGIARVDGQVVFVPGALPGELCRIRIAHIGRSAVFAELLRVEQPSAHRVEPDCPYFPKCGGCALRHMDYTQELELKRTHVHSCLTRIGGQTLSSLPITGAEQTDGYRNKVQLPVQEPVQLVQAVLHPVEHRPEQRPAHPLDAAVSGIALSSLNTAAA